MNKEKLGLAIKNSGLKQAAIAERMSMPASTFYTKTNGITSFTVAESLVIKRILNLTWDEFEAIFFENEVPKTEQRCEA